jgi:hypothetical protein
MRRVFAALLTAVTVAGATSCVRAGRPALQPSPGVPGATLWQRPNDISSRDLFFGPWGRQHAPDPHATYTLVELKHTGVNLGMTVRDPQDREWSVKQSYPGNMDSEGPVEVAVSRLLSAVGYQQPPVYFLPAFTLKDDWGTHAERGGRFRLKEDTLKEVGPWSWQENPFIGTRPYQGLLVLMMMINNTDLKNSNNSVYEHRTGDRVDQWYVVRDVGAALGDTLRFAPRKGNPAAFERHPFVLGVNDGHVDFAYKGWYQALVRDRITPADVAWTTDLLSQLRDGQWQDAFRAAGYPPEEANRFIRKFQEKIAEGRALERRAAVD